MSIQKVSFGVNPKINKLGKVIQRKADKLSHIDLCSQETSTAVRLTWQRQGIRNNPNIIVRPDEPFDVVFSKAYIQTPNGKKVVECRKTYPLKK